MKGRIVAWLCVFEWIWHPLYAQYSYVLANDSSGIYLTYDDFVKGRVLHGFPNFKKGYTIWPKGVFSNKDLKLTAPDTSFVYKRSGLWGYTDHKGRLIRVFHENYYKVLCDKGLVVYVTSSPTRVSYYFSKTCDDNIVRLTKRNLMAAYSGQDFFLQKIKRSDKKEWLLWNDIAECYYINNLLSE